MRCVCKICLEGQYTCVADARPGIDVRTGTFLDSLTSFQVFTGGLSSFTLFNMVSGILQHQAVTRARPHPPAFLPLLDALPKQSVLAHLQPEDLPTRFLPPLGARNQDMHERFTYCGLHAANSSWHLPPPTPFEEHVRSHRQKATGSGNGIASGASSRDDAWDPWSPERRGEGSGSGVMHGLQQLEFVRAAVSEGPDLGDLLLDLLHVCCLLFSAHAC